MSTKMPPGGASAGNQTQHHSGLVGFVDECRDGAIWGWAQIPWSPSHPAIVEILLDGVPAGVAKANQFRSDLRELGIREGYAGFVFKVPPAFIDGKSHTVHVIERHSKKRLAGLGQIQIAPIEAEATRSEIFFNSVHLASNIDNKAFQEGVRTRKKVAVLCAFTPKNDLYNYHHRLIESLQAQGFTVLLGQSYTSAEGSDGTSPPPPVSKAEAYIVKDNLGYDFGTWLACVHAIRDTIPRLDELLLINDSIFGPFSKASEFWKKVSDCNADVVGVCDSYEHNFHLQSFFLLFRKNILASSFFPDLLDGYSYSSDKDKVIKEGELALTPLLTSRGFSCEAVYPYEMLASKWLEKLPTIMQEMMNLPENSVHWDKTTRPPEVEYLVNLGRHIRRGEPVNPTHYFWDVLLELGCPFIKRELLLKNPGNNPLLYRARESISNQGYPTTLIKDAACRFGATKVFF
jgi:hypothetical protein